MDTLYHDYLYTPSYNHPSPMGVYALMDVRSNKLYVGSTVNFSIRSAQHFKLLEEGIHFNRNLQFEFDREGASAFTFIVLESGIAEEELAEREQIWLNRFKRKALNIHKIVSRPEWEIVQPVDRTDFPWDDST